MLEALGTALVNLLAVKHLAYMTLGISVGLMVGILPGLGGIAGMSLLIPFIYGMDQVSALAMLVGLVAVIPTGDTFTSVLMGIPGSSASQATVLDGFPMAKKGQAARALSAAFSASLLGGVFGAIVLTGFVVIARPLILFFGTAELFMLAVLGLSVVGVLAGASVARGIAACGLGLLIGAIGAAPATGETRFDLGIAYLQDGVPLVIIGLGLFAIPEIAELMRRNQPISEKSGLGGGWLTGVADTMRHWFIVLRCATLGTIVGAIPGLGGGVVDWIAYGHVVQTSRDQSQFGKGDVRGVIAPESANNALQGGALMPTLLFGIPGSGSMAVFLGGMVLLGIQPGPSMVTTELHLTYTIAWTLALASVIGAAICFLLAAPISRLSYVPFNLISPFMIMIICFAAFQARRSLVDLLVLFAVGLLGILLRRFGWPRPAFLIGFVLADQAENYLYQSVQFYGWGFLQRPGVLVIGGLALASILLAMRGRVSDDGVAVKPVASAAQPDQPQAAVQILGGTSTKERWPQIVFALLVTAAFVYALIDSIRLSFLGSVFPASVAALMLVFAAYLLAMMIFARPGHNTHYDQELAARLTTNDETSIWPSVGWFALLFGLCALVGFILSIAVVIPALLMARARLGLGGTLLYTVLCVGFMVGMGYMLVLDFPPGLLQSYATLPWPLR